MKWKSPLAKPRTLLEDKADLTSRQQANTNCAWCVSCSCCSQGGPTELGLKLFKWPEGSKRTGEGVRHLDMVKLVKRCAEECGRDTKLYSSHSIRKGGASEYLVAGGWTLHEVALFGRWRGERIAGLYVEKVVGQLSEGMQTKVLSGKRESRARFKKTPRDRDVRIHRIKRALKKAD